MKMPPKASLGQTRKLLIQTAALLGMTLIPVFLFLAAQAGATASIYPLLGVMAATMVLSIVIS